MVTLACPLWKPILVSLDCTRVSRQQLHTESAPWLQEGEVRANSPWWPHLRKRRMGLPSWLQPSAAAVSPGMRLLPCCMLGQAQKLTPPHLQPVLAASGSRGKHCPLMPELHVLCCLWPGCCTSSSPSKAASVQPTPLAMERAAQCMQVEETVAFGEQRVRLRSVPRHHRNTLLHTGLMLWDSGPVLARLLLACPALTAGQAPFPSCCALTWRLPHPCHI